MNPDKFLGIGTSLILKSLHGLNDRSDRWAQEVTPIRPYREACFIDQPLPLTALEFDLHSLNLRSSFKLCAV